MQLGYILAALALLAALKAGQLLIRLGVSTSSFLASPGNGPSTSRVDLAGNSRQARSRRRSFVAISSVALWLSIYVAIAIRLGIL